MPPAAGFLVEHDFFPAAQAFGQLFPEEPKVSKRGINLACKTLRVECVGASGGQSDLPEPLTERPLDDRFGLSRRFDHGLVAVGHPFVDPTLAVAHSPRHITIRVDDVEWRVYVFKLDVLHHKAESIRRDSFFQEPASSRLGVSAAVRQEIKYARGGR